jgi:hypothetical protein
VKWIQLNKKLLEYRSHQSWINKWSNTNDVNI